MHNGGFEKHFLHCSVGSGDVVEHSSLLVSKRGEAERLTEHYHHLDHHDHDLDHHDHLQVEFCSTFSRGDGHDIFCWNLVNCPTG